MIIPSDMSAVAQPVTEKFLQVAFLSGRLNSELFDEGEEDLIRWGPYPRVDPATSNPLENPPSPMEQLTIFLLGFHWRFI